MLKLTGPEPKFEFYEEIDFHNFDFGFPEYIGDMHRHECAGGERRLRDESPEEEGRRLDEAGKKQGKAFAVDVLKTFQSGHAFINAFKKEQQRLARRALVGYTVGAIIVMLVAWKGTKYYQERRKWVGVAAGDEDALMQDSQ